VAQVASGLRLRHKDISEYNSPFEKALTDLLREITDEQVKIEKYKSDLQVDLRELARFLWQEVDFSG
jgi:hypothetical protein